MKKKYLENMYEKQQLETQIKHTESLITQMTKNIQKEILQLKIYIEEEEIQGQILSGNLRTLIRKIKQFETYEIQV